MKTFLSLLFLCVMSVSISAQEFKFETETINYGKVLKNSNKIRTFVFTNIGNQPIIIKNIKSACGCTVPEKPTKPIMPGEKGEIKVSYDTSRMGGFSKTITIFSNAKNPAKQIKIRGHVDKELSFEKEKSMLSENE